MQAAKPLFDYPKYWAECFGPAPFLPMSREEMDQLGWDSCDIIIVTGDAYVDHPSFGMAIIGRLLESQGFRVGIIAQPNWQSKDDFMKLGEPNLFFGVAAGNMDSMINRYTADKKIRSDDAYTPGGMAGKRPDRASLVYSQRCKEAYKHVPIVLGGIEASLRRIAHYDYWQDRVRNSILIDASADILLYGNAERAIVEVAQRLSYGQKVEDITDVRGTAFIRRDTPQGWYEVDSTRIDRPGKVDKIINPYVNTQDTQACAIEQEKGPVEDPNEAKVVQLLDSPRMTRDKTVIRLPSMEKVRNDPVLYAHANRVLHLETNPGNARALVQKHGEVDVWFNPPPIPTDHRRNGLRVRHALRACSAPGVRQGKNPGLRHDPFLGQHHARLLRRLHLLLDHRARRADHPEPLGRVDHPRDRRDPRQGAGLYRGDF